MMVVFFYGILRNLWLFHDKNFFECGCLAINYQKHAKIPTEKTKRERNLQPTESYNLLHSNTLQLQITYPKRDEIFMVNSK